MTSKQLSAASVEQRFREHLQSLTSLNSALVYRSDAAGCSFKEAGSAEWTNALQNILLEMGNESGFHVYPRRRYFARSSRGTNCTFDRPEARKDDRGEWLVDACWTRYPDSKDWVRALRSGSAPKEGGLALACESEWASGRFGIQDGETHVSLVLDDFAKLVDLRASLKILIFAFQPDLADDIAGFGDIVALCRRIAEPVNQGEEYLLMGWPSSATWAERLTELRSVTLV